MKKDNIKSIIVLTAVCLVVTLALSGINQPHYLVQVGLIDRPELDVRGAYYICQQIEPDGSYYICTNREIDISYCICPYRESALRAD